MNLIQRYRAKRPSRPLGGKGHRSAPNQPLALQLTALLFTSLLFPAGAPCHAHAQEHSQGRIRLLIYDEGARVAQRPWFPNSMPDGHDISLNLSCESNPHTGRTCIEVTFVPLQNEWAGIYWLANDSWKGPGVNVYERMNGGSDLRVRLTFWARGEMGGERVRFLAGGVAESSESLQPAIGTTWIRLTEVWRQYEIGLSGGDLTHLVGGFCWVTNIAMNPGRHHTRFFLDDIQFEPEEN